MPVVVLAWLLAGAQLSAAPLGPAREAVARQISREFAKQCSRAELSDAAATAKIQRIGTLDGDAVVLAMIYGPCLSGNANGPWLVVRVSPAATKPLLRTFAQDVHIIPTNDALPRLYEQMHGSAYVSGVKIDEFSAGRYVVVDSYNMCNATGERIPGTLPVKFAPGASSARLTGKFGEFGCDSGAIYAFYASKGQRLNVDGIKSTSVIFMVLSQTANRNTVVHPGETETLDHSGLFTLSVSSNGSSERHVRYAFTLQIR